MRFVGGMFVLILSWFSFGQTVKIPDPHFKTYLLTFYDTNHDGEISVNEAEAVIRMVCDSRQIADLTGIAAFTNLEELSCYENQLTGMPGISSLTKLWRLDAGSNQLTSLPDLSALTNLTNLPIWSSVKPPFGGR